MSDTTLIVHIGAHKSGSTTIQEVFASGGLKLEGVDLLYPARLDHNYLRADFISHESGDPLPKRGPRQLGFAALAEQIAESEADYALLSAEYFENLRPELMKDVLDQYFAPHVGAIKIVAYLRPHAPRLLSGYAEALKIGWFQGGFEAFLEQSLARKDILYVERFMRWKEVFGENLVLRPMLREQLSGGSLLQDFAEVAFGAHEKLAQSDIAQNQSLTLPDLAFLKLVQERFQSRREWLRHSFGWELARQLRQTSLPDEAAGERLYLHQALAARLHAVCRADAAACDEIFFEGKSLFAADLKRAVSEARPEPAVLEPEAYFSAEELRNLRAIRELLWDVMSTRHNWATHFHSFRFKALERLEGLE